MFVFLKDFCEKVDVENFQQTIKGMQNYPMNTSLLKEKQINCCLVITNMATCPHYMPG